MTELQQNRYDQLLRRLGDLKGPGSMVSDVISELFPMIDVERVPGELLLLGGTRICFGSIAVTGAAGQRPRAQLFNPDDSGMIISVSSVRVTVDVTTRVRYTVNAIALTNGVGTESFRDTRLPVTARPVGQIRSDSTVAITDATGQFNLQPNTLGDLPEENTVAVLIPGSGIEVGNFDIATQIIATFTWRERVAEPSELNL